MKYKTMIMPHAVSHMENLIKILLLSQQYARKEIGLDNLSSHLNDMVYI